MKSSQRLEGDAFLGSPVSAKPLLPKLEFTPRSSTIHADGGNTGSVDYPGPLGQALNLTSIDLSGLGVFYWDALGTMYGIYIGPCNGSDTNLIQAIAVLDPETLAIESAWQLPYTKTTQLNTAYTQVLMETAEIVVNSVGGQIYILQKSEDAAGSPTIGLRRTIDLTTSGILKGYRLLNTMMDSAGNVWFTTGVLDGIGGPAGISAGAATNTSIIGYVEPDGMIHSLEVPNQDIGQGIAVTNTTVFVNTQPSGKDDHADAEGFISALRPGPGTTIDVVWNATDKAGSKRKPGALARGSGTTPSLLGNDFVALCNNADGQIDLLIYAQNASGHDIQPICTVPLWQPNASWTDNGPMVHFDGKDYGVVLENMYNAPAYADTHNDTNGPWNNLTGQVPGISKILVAGDGSGCHVAWTNPGRTTTVPILSTTTGLLYEYEQSAELADEGEYVWYAKAIDYMSGKTVWKARTGAGGKFNNNLRTTLLSPEGTLYQMVTGGVVAIRDGEC
ncbi:hypothetical protein EV356DRAFT_135993 [Viridothelium virens]|uniref:Uncharacterized protein n=1 Tax=Viridothelium virens TaxID=1048519 RepID=A0A6A6H9N1_VIRVR|nr:hypothetical protein EV356DRAFT_135993 [Viridothelium virens]